MGLGITSKLRRARDLARFFYVQRVVGFDVPDQPHFDPVSTEPFLAMLAGATFYLEFGSGGSTVAAARLGIETVTVENDRYFANAVKTKIGAKAPNTMLVIDTGITVEWSFPLFTEKTPARLRKWASYIETPLKVVTQRQGVFPDLILVDGRFRKACALGCAAGAIEQGAATTICFDDYLERPWYHDVENHLGKPEMIGRMAVFKVLSQNTPPPAEAIAAARLDPR